MPGRRWRDIARIRRNRRFPIMTAMIPMRSRRRRAFRVIMLRREGRRMKSQQRGHGDSRQNGTLRQPVNTHGTFIIG